MVRVLAMLLLLGCDDPPPTVEADPRVAPPVPPQAVDTPPAGDERPEVEIVEAPPGVVEAPRAEQAAARRCAPPAIPIPRPPACGRGAPYPECKWQMPSATLAEGRYRRWRNTIVEHWWGRPALVTTLLAVTDAYHREVPDQILAIGDLDAPGPRHQTHKSGVDVDIYLPGAMMVENAGGGRYPSNYSDKAETELDALRFRVEALARALATCTGGRLRIYYNDEVVLTRFHAWYDQQGFEENPFGRPMQRHNRLHDFHFHITIADDQEPLPLPDGVDHPIAEIEPPPPPESAPHLSSRSRRSGDWAAVPRE